MSDKLNPEIWKGMSPEAQAAYAERNALAWRIVRSVLPGAGGGVDDYEPKVTDTIERLRADLAHQVQLASKINTQYMSTLIELARYKAVAEAARAYREWVRSIYKDEPTFHFAPLKQAMFDAVDALDSPGGGGAHD